MAKISINGKKIGRPKDPSSWLTKKCLGCGNIFEKRKCYEKRASINYCSFDCYKKDRTVEIKCRSCGKSFKTYKCYVSRGQMRACSMKCRSIGGEHNPHWKGGRRIDDDGYIGLLMPKHPNCSKQGYVLEHRFVMEKKIGRYLKPKEAVHHINEIKNDNRIENLILFANNGEHNRHHAKIRQHNRTL